MSAVFGMRLREIRKREGHTTVSAAKALCVSQPTYNTWELGTREPNIDKILALCQLLNTSPNELLGFTSSNATPNVQAGGNSQVAIGNQAPVIYARRNVTINTGNATVESEKERARRERAIRKFKFK